MDSHPVPQTDASEISPSQRLAFYVFRYMKQQVANASESAIRRYETWFYWLCYYVLRVCRREVWANLKLAFPQESPAFYKQLAKRNYQWFARLVFDILKMERWKGKTLDYCRFHNLEALEAAVNEERGVLLVGGHFGSWEIIGPALVEQGHTVHLYTGAQTNHWVDTMQDQVRASLGVNIISKGPQARIGFLKALRGRQMLAMLVDQNDRKSDLFVDFFGVPASMSRGVAAFHIIKKSPIVMIYPIIDDKGQIELQFERIHSTLTGNKDADTQTVSQQVTDALEKKVREFPEQYFWMHRRWKSRPPEDKTPVY